MSTFKRSSKLLTATDQTIYTAPAGGSIIIGVLAAHNGSNNGTYGMSIRIKRGTTETYLLAEGTQLFSKSALSIDSGKVVLENGDTIIAKASPVNVSNVDNVVDLNISIMEF